MLAVRTIPTRFEFQWLCRHPYDCGQAAAFSHVLTQLFRTALRSLPCGGVSEGTRLMVPQSQRIAQFGTGLLQ